VNSKNHQIKNYKAPIFPPEHLVATSLVESEISFAPFTNCVIVRRNHHPRARTALVPEPRLPHIWPARHGQHHARKHLCMVKAIDAKSEIPEQLR